MNNAKKSFDCVEMKNKIQRELMTEYEKRKGEFTSYMHFINASANMDPQIQAFREKKTPAKHL